MEVDWKSVAERNLHKLQYDIIVAASKTTEELSPSTFTRAKMSLSAISYHFRVLEKHGLLKLTRTKQIRGTLKHFYVIHPMIVKGARKG